jgi:hypothetical protein
VDSGTKKVYQYVAAAGRTSGSQKAASSFALAAGNTNPQDIADPPSPDMLLTSVASPLAPNQLPVLDRPAVGGPAERGPVLGLNGKDDMAALSGNVMPIGARSLWLEPSGPSGSAPFVSPDSTVLMGPSSALQTGLAQHPGPVAADGSWSSSHAGRLAVTDYLFSEEPLWHASLAEAAASLL